MERPSARRAGFGMSDALCRGILSAREFSPCLVWGWRGCCTSCCTRVRAPGAPQDEVPLWRCDPPSIAQLRALHPPARSCLCPCSRQLPCGSTGPTPAQGLGPRFVRSPFPSLSPSRIRLRGSELPEMGLQGLCTKQSLLAPGDRPEVPAPHPAGERRPVPFTLQDVGWAVLRPPRPPAAHWERGLALLQSWRGADDGGRGT